MSRELTEFGDLQIREEDFADLPTVALDGEKIPDSLSKCFVELLPHNKRLREAWEGGSYPSLSEQAYSLMYFCGLFGIPKGDSARVHVGLYEKHGRKDDGIRKAPYALRAWVKGREDAEKYDQSLGNGQPERRVSTESPGQRATAPEGPEVEQLPPEAPEGDLPVFPEIAYRGLAAEIAHAYAECLEAPKEFFYMDNLAFLGAAICNLVRLDSQLYEEPRLYVVKVGESWSSRKSSSQENTERQYAPLLQDRVTPCYGTGSAEGLAKLLEKGLPTMLVYDEFRSFVDKAGVQQSVLLPMVATLFHRTVYENATKNSEIRLTDAHLSLIAACTSETFTTMFNPSFRNIGFLNRLFIVTGKRSTRKAIPKSLDFGVIETLRKRTKAQIERAEQERPALSFTADAARLWSDWYYSMPDSPYAARLDTYGLRLLMLLAITTESWRITRPLVESVLPLLDYELAVRRELDPVDAENVVAKMERLILRHLSKGRMPQKRLQNFCNVRHYGSWVFDQAIKNAQRQDWVRSKRIGKGLVHWLTEGGVEAAKE